MDLKERDALGDQADRHWYYVSKAKMVARHFPPAPRLLLDVGAGLGWFSRWYVEHGFVPKAICVDPGYALERIERPVGGGALHFVRSVEATDADLILMMDVLEHVDDDVAFLAAYWEKARSGAVFVVTVPAFEALWSAHDDFLGHRRRYTVRRLEAVVRTVGAVPSRLHYFFAGVTPIAAAVRWWRRTGTAAEQSDMRPVAPPMNALLKAVCRLERAVMRWNRVVGLSVVARFEKP